MFISRHGSKFFRLSLLEISCTGSNLSKMTSSVPVQETISNVYQQPMLKKSLFRLSVSKLASTPVQETIWAAACDFQQFDVSTSVDSDEPLKPPNSKWCSVSSLTIIEYSSDQQWLWSDCAYAQADLRLCWSHIPHCWKSHALAQFSNVCLAINWLDDKINKLLSLFVNSDI